MTFQVSVRLMGWSCINSSNDDSSRSLYVKATNKISSQVFQIKIIEKTPNKRTIKIDGVPHFVFIDFQSQLAENQLTDWHKN